MYHVEIERVINAINNYFWILLSHGDNFLPARNNFSIKCRILLIKNFKLLIKSINLNRFIVYSRFSIRINLTILNFAFVLLIRSSNGSSNFLVQYRSRMLSA